MWRLTFLLISAFLFSVGSLHASEEARLREIHSKIEKNKTHIKEKIIERNIAKKQFSTILRELKYTEVELSKTQKNLRHAQEQEQKSRVKLSVLDDRFREKKTLFEKRLCELYKTESLGILDLLFSDKEFIFSIESDYFFDRLIKADANFIQTLKLESLLVKKQKQLWEAQADQVERLKKNIIEKEKLLVEKRSEQAHHIQSLTSQIAEMEKKNKILEKSSEELTALIRRQGAGKNTYYASGRMVKPSKGWFSSGFGMRFHPLFKRRIMHRGIDIAGPQGTPIYAAEAGEVIVAGDMPQYRGYGQVTVLDHGKRPDGKRLSTVYAHQSRIFVREGEFVKKGQLIGHIGSTGYSTGPHLHFEVRVDGVPVNPQSFISI